MAQQFACTVKVPVGATPTNLLYQMSGTLTGETDTAEAIDDGVTGFVAVNPTVQRWRIEGEAHIDDTDNPALEVIRDAWVNKTELSACKIDFTTTGWSGSGDCYVTAFGGGKTTQEYPTITFTLTGDGALAFS